jgi:multisubunit Na+/H+ antiporter MnhG subunit
MPFLAANVSQSQSKDAGLALVLICLILAWGGASRFFLLLGIGFLLVTMTAPVLFKPFARVWFGFSHALGTVVSRILLTILFFLLVTPVGIIRRMLGKDAMQTKSWKRSLASVFQNRDHLYTAQDLDHPY